MNSMLRCSLMGLLIGGAVALSSSNLDAKVYKVYYLGGQSNMDGFGTVAELPEDMKPPVDGVMIFHGNTEADAKPVDGRGKWGPLVPGHGTGFKTDGTTDTLSDRFGVELSFARRLRELHPETPIAIIKYSRGGASIDVAAAGEYGSFDPEFTGGEAEGKGINQYDHMLATFRHAFAVRDIDGDGENDELIPAGIIWMQGESDAAYSEEIAQRYEANLKRFLDLVRAALRNDDLPVVVGQISDSGQDGDGKVWNQGEIVRTAQASFVSKDPAAALVPTDAYAYSDPWHYNSAGYIELGRAFADAISALEKR